MTTFAERLTELREKSGKKRQEVADDLGISRASLEYYEKGKRKPDTDILFRIAKYFNASADYLIGLSDVPTTNKDLKFVCEYTGLSEKAVEELAFYKSPDTDIEFTWNFGSKNFEILNKLFEREVIFDICSYIGFHCEAANTANIIASNALDVYERIGYCETELEKENEKLEELKNELDLTLFRLQNLITDFTKDYSDYFETTEIMQEVLCLLKRGADNGKHN
ncbi:MAG: helix-turn-helix domain-containing protein [Acutalibacteraceae bacterium]